MMRKKDVIDTQMIISLSTNSNHTVSIDELEIKCFVSFGLSVFPDRLWVLFHDVEVEHEKTAVLSDRSKFISIWTKSDLFDATLSLFKSLVDGVEVKYWIWIDLGLVELESW